MCKNKTLDNIFGYERRYDFKKLFIDFLTLVQLYVVLSMYFWVYKYNLDSLLDYSRFELLVFLWFPLAASSSSLYSRLKDFFFVVGGRVVTSFIVNLTMILGFEVEGIRTVPGSIESS